MDQSEWRFCGKCFSLFFDGYPGKGFCPSDGHDHVANGYMFVLPHDIPETGTAQGAWRFCDKDFVMFFDGRPDKGVCDAGGGHHAAGYTFVLPHDVPGTATAQTAWRFCGKCAGMFYDGYDSKGHCPKGGGHEAAGFMFVLPHLDDDVLTFDTGPVTSNLPLGGSAHVVVNRTGSFTFSTHTHDSGFDSIDYTMAVVLLSPRGVGYSFTRSGGVEGTSAGLPFGTPRRNDDQTTPGTNPSITAQFDQLKDAVLVAQLSGDDALVGGVSGLVKDALDAAAKSLGTAAGAALVALV